MDMCVHKDHALLPKPASAAWTALVWIQLFQISACVMFCPAISSGDLFGGCPVSFTRPVRVVLARCPTLRTPAFCDDKHSAPVPSVCCRSTMILLPCKPSHAHKHSVKPRPCHCKSSWLNLNIILSTTLHHTLRGSLNQPAEPCARHTYVYLYIHVCM